MSIESRTPRESTSNPEKPLAESGEKFDVTKATPEEIRARYEKVVKGKESPTKTEKIPEESVQPIKPEAPTKSESVLDDFPDQFGMETVVGRAEAEPTRKIERKTPEVIAEKNPIEEWNDLIHAKEEIISKISSGELGKKEGERQKKEASWKIIEQGCKILGRDFQKEKENINTEEDKQWKKSIEISFGGEKKYNEWEKTNAEGVALRRETDVILNAKWTKLPDEQRKRYGNVNNFYETARESVFRRTTDNHGKNGIVLSREAFCGLLQQGFDPENIRGAGVWETIQHSVGRLAVWDAIRDMSREGWLVAVPFTDVDGRKGSELMTQGKLEEFIAKAGADFKRVAFKKSESVLGELSEKRKEATIEQSIEQTVLNQKIIEIQNILLQQQEQRRQTKKQKKSQLPEKPIETEDVLSDTITKSAEKRKNNKRLSKATINFIKKQSDEALDYFNKQLKNGGETGENENKIKLLEAVQKGFKGEKPTVNGLARALVFFFEALENKDWRLQLTEEERKRLSKIIRELANQIRGKDTTIWHDADKMLNTNREQKIREERLKSWPKEKQKDYDTMFKLKVEEGAIKKMVERIKQKTKNKK